MTQAICLDPTCHRHPPAGELYCEDHNNDGMRLQRLSTRHVKTPRGIVTGRTDPGESLDGLDDD